MQDLLHRAHPRLQLAEQTAEVSRALKPPPISSPCSAWELLLASFSLATRGHGCLGHSARVQTHPGGLFWGAGSLCLV